MVIVLNGIVISLLWRSTKVSLYGHMLLPWCGGTFGLITSSLTVQSDFFIQTLGFSGNFFAYLGIAIFLSKLNKIAMNIKKYLLLFIFGNCLFTALYKFTVLPEKILLGIMCLNIVYPCLAMGAKSFYKVRKGFSLAARLFAINAVIGGLYNFVYIFTYNMPDVMPWVWAIAFVFPIAMTLLGPGLVVESAIKERMELSYELEYNAKLSYSSKLAAIAEVASGIAHEINNPLAVMQLSLNKYSKHLQDSNYQEELFYKEFSNSMSFQISKISKIIRGLMDFSDTSRSGSFEVVNIEEVIDRVRLFFTEKFKNYNIKFHIDFTFQGAKVLGNFQELVQVLINLLSNAFEAIVHQQERIILLTIDRRDEYLIISVKDNGPGVKLDQVDKIFQPFFTTKETGEGVGSGLGLSVSKGIIESHGGNLIYEKSDNFTCFKIGLKLLAAPG